MRQYLKAGLLDEMQIHLIPVLLGGGVRLFEGLNPEGSNCGGQVQSRHRVLRTFGSTL